jgi:hypothetical protein
MATTNHPPRLVKSSCGLLVDPCEQALLRPLPGAHFEFVGKVSEFKPEADGGEPWIDLAEAARRLGYERKTLYGWIEKDVLRAEHGLKKIRGRWRINWPILLDRIDSEEFGPCS